MLRPPPVRDRPPPPQGRHPAQLRRRGPQSGIPGLRVGWGLGRGWTDTPTHTQTTHGPQHTRVHSFRYTHSETLSHVQLHTHTHNTPQKTPDSKTHPETARSYSTQKHGDTRSHTYTHSRPSRPAWRPHKVAESTEGVSRETPAFAAPPARNGRGRRPAAQSQARPARTHPRPAALEQPRPGPRRSARPPGLPLPPASARPAGPRVRPPPPRPTLPGPGPGAPQPRRRLGSAASQRRAELAKQQTARNVGVSGRRAPIPPWRASGPARPGRGGEGRRREGAPPRQLVPGPRAPHAHPRDTHTHTHTHPATAPSGGPGPRAHTQTRPRRAPHSQHSRTRSQHARTHSHPFQTRSYTRIPGTLGIHSDPRSPPAAHTTNPRHSHTYTLRTRRTDTHVPDPFPRFHTRTRISQAHTPHTRSLLHTRAESTEHSSPHAEHKHTSHSRTHNKQHSGLGHTKCPQMQHISRHNSCHTTKLKCTNNRHTILLGPTHTTQWQRHKSAHPMPRCTQHSPQHTRGHTTHTAPLLAHNSGHTPFAGTQPEHTIAHPTLRHTGSRLATSGHPTLPLSFELRHGRRGLRGASWVRPTRAYLPESRSRARRAGR